MVDSFGFVAIVFLYSHVNFFMKYFSGTSTLFSLNVPIYVDDDFSHLHSVNFLSHAMCINRCSF